MSSRKPLAPVLESLEKKTVLSAGVASAHLAAVEMKQPGVARSSSSSPDNDADLASNETRHAELSGPATGSYTSRQGPPGTGTRFHVQASGTITPIGPAVVTGSFTTLSTSNGSAGTGTLTIVGSTGKLRLKLTEPGLVAAELSTEDGEHVNPGGPMIPAITSTSEPTAGGPATLVNRFDYKIVGGTGSYAHDRGTGTVEIETTPGLSAPSGPGIYASSLASTGGLGRTVLTFTSA